MDCALKINPNDGRKPVFVLLIYSIVLDILYLPFSPFYILAFGDISIILWVLVNTLFGILFLLLYTSLIKLKYVVLVFLIIPYLILNIFPLLAYRAQHFPPAYQYIHLLAIIIAAISIAYLIYKMTSMKSDIGG